LHGERTEDHGKKKTSLLAVAAKSALIGVAIIFIFGLGVGVGNGTVGVTKVNPQNKQLSADLDYSTVEELYDELRVQYDGKLDQAKLLDGLKAGLASAAGDRYTVFLNAKDAKDFNDQLEGNFSGIGAELGKDDADNLIIVAPIAGTPAAKADIRPQDLIVSVDGKSTDGWSIEEAVTKIRGEKGTKVTLKVVRVRRRS